jgi:hypothetical protein
MMPFIHVKTIDDKDLWINLAQVTAFSYSPDEPICLIEISGGEPHQISMEEFDKFKSLVLPRSAKKTKKSNKK